MSPKLLLAAFASVLLGSVSVSVSAQEFREPPDPSTQGSASFESSGDSEYSEGSKILEGVGDSGDSGDSADSADSPAPKSKPDSPELDNAAAKAWRPQLSSGDFTRVQRRLHPKSRRIFVDLGGEYLARGDFHHAPGLGLSMAWFFGESWAAELGASHYFSFLNSAASQVRKETGLVPNSKAPAWHFRAGARVSLGYGKVASLGHIFHLEPQLFVRASALLAEGQPSWGGELGAGLLLHLTQLVHLRLDVSAFPHAEKRDGWTFVFGVAPWLSVGVALP